MSKISIAKSLTTKLININEAVAINYGSYQKYIKYLDLASKKFGLGPSKEFKLSGTEYYVRKFGPCTNKLLKGKFVYLFLDFTQSSNEKFGYIESFAVSDKDYTGGFKLSGENCSVDGLAFKPIPGDFVKIQDAMNLIIGAGAQFEDDKTKLTSALLNGTDKTEVVNINKRFEIMAKLVRIIGMKKLPGMIIVGKGGLGKTYTVMETLKSLGMLDQEHYIYLQGAKLTTVEFYALLYNNQDKLIIFDDSDSVVQDGDRINMLKSALDSGGGPRIVSYLSPAVTQRDMPQSFDFQGQIIFISNYALKDFDQPLISRSVAVDLSMTRKEVFERMQSIIDKMSDNVDPEAIKKSGDEDEDQTGKIIPKEAQQEALDTLMAYDKKHPGKPNDLNMRTLGKVAKVLQAEPADGPEIVDYLLSIG